jgi:segregation and condensation protein B
MTATSQLEAAIEAVLFASSDPVQLARLNEVFADEGPEAVAAALERVLGRFEDEEGERGVRVERVAGGYRLVTRPELHGYLRRYFDISGHNRLSMAGLETLAIVAYRQPITGPEIQEMRGVNSSGVLKTLLDRRLIRISGRKQVVGKPFIYRTTREFLMHFGLQDLNDLPPLEEFEESFGSLEQELELESPVGEGLLSEEVLEASPEDDPRYADEVGDAEEELLEPASSTSSEEE